MSAHKACGVEVNGDMDIWQNNWTNETYQYFAVDKMRFAKIRDENGTLVADKARIIYNDHITIENIPLKAYEYVVNGKSAIEWIMERYAITIDKASQIKMIQTTGHENMNNHVISLTCFYLPLCYLAKQWI